MGDKEKKELIMLAAGIAILIITWVATHQPNKEMKAVVYMDEIIPVRPAPRMDEAIEQTSAVKGGAPVTREIVYTGRGNRDPMDNSVVRERGTETGEGPKVRFPVENFSVSAIIWNSKKPQAIINNKIVSIGGMVEGGRIVGIDKKGVHIDCGGEEFLLGIK